MSEWNARWFVWISLISSLLVSLNVGKILSGFFLNCLEGLRRGAGLCQVLLSSIQSGMASGKGTIVGLEFIRAVQVCA